MNVMVKLKMCRLNGVATIEITYTRHKYKHPTEYHFFAVIEEGKMAIAL